MNIVTATQVAVAGVKIGRTIANHRKEMKKLRAERKFWEDLNDNLKTVAEKPQPIYVKCERLA